MPSPGTTPVQLRGPEWGMEDYARELARVEERVRVLEGALRAISSRLIASDHMFNANCLCDWCIAFAALAPRAEGRTDGERLDWLERHRQTLNAYNGTEYGWRVILSHNVTRLMVRDVNTIDVNDANAGANRGTNIRAAIDAAMEAEHG